MSTTRNMIFIVHDIVNMSEYNIQTSKWKNFEFNRDIENYDPTQIFAQIQSATNLKKIKAMVFTIMDLCFPTIAHAYEFRLKCSEFCKSNGILYFYIPVSSIIAFSVMSKAKVMVEEGEEIIISCPSSASSQIYSNLLIRKKDHYQVIRSQTDSDLSLSQEWKKKLLKNSNPKKVILMRLSPMDSAHFLLKCSHLFENALVIREESHFASIHNVIVEKVMHVLGDKITPYDVTIQCLSKIAVLMDEVLLINVEYIKALPFEESVIIDVDPGKVVTVVGSSQSPKNFPIVFQKNSIKLSTFKTKKAKVTLKIDINSFHDLKVEPIDEDIMDEKLSKMEHLSDAQFRLVFDKQNFCVFAVKDAKEQTQIRASDGSEKIPIYIAFTDKKPVIGKAAEEICVQQPKLVVFDLIKLCSITNGDIMNPKWGFKVEKEEENESLMVTVETIEGERRSSVEFLLALILKHGLQLIKNEIGKKIDKIEVKFDGFIPNEMLKKNFIEAGKLVKTDIDFC